MRPPRPWWNALARGHEQRREVTQAIRLALSSDLPLYGIGEEWPGDREVRIGRCRATFRRGPFGLRVQVGPVVVDEITAHHETPAAALNVTSYRPGEAVPSRSRLVSSFLSVSWVIDEAREAGGEDGPSEPSPRGPSKWQSVLVDVDGEAQPFEQMTAGDHWLALGSVAGHQLSIEAHGLAAMPPPLRRIVDLPAWVRSPAAAAGNRPIVELGDRLGDLFGLP